MKLTHNQKTWLSIAATSLAIGGFFVFYEFVPKIGGKIFLAIVAFLLIKWINDFIRHEQNN